MARPNLDDMPVTTGPDIPGRQCEVVGVVQVKHGLLYNTKRTLLGLKQQAHRKGADAVVGLNLGPLAATGTAVRFKG